MMKALTKQEVKNVIEGKRTTERIPNLCAFWIYPDVYGEREEEIRQWRDSNVYDIDVQYVRLPSITAGTEEDPEYCWLPAGKRQKMEGSIDNTVYLEDWEDEEFVEEMYAKFPSSDSPNVFIPKELDHSKYVIAQWHNVLFESHWYLRGMENALTDFLLYPDEVHRLYQAMTDYFVGVIERAKREHNADGIFCSDDIGTQTGPFFSLKIFREFFKPYYKQMIDKAHELGMHFWLHTCGNIELFMEDFIEIGLDVIHPIQKYTMDEKQIVAKYGGRICFLVGFDVQQVIPYGTVEEVRAETRFLIDTFSRDDGRFMLTMGNGSTKDWKKECVQAIYDELAGN